MSRRGAVYCNGVLAGVLERDGEGYMFRYNESYRSDRSLPPVSLSLSKSRSVYRSRNLFPFFFGLLAEGADKALQCTSLKIDEHDHFTRLLKTAGENTIGAVTVREET